MIFRPTPIPYHTRARGAALMIVMSSIVLLAFAIAGVIELTRQARDESRYAAQVFEARLLAESGIALGTHPDVESTDPVLHQELEGGYLLDVTITSEQGRLLINNVSEDWMIDGLRELFTNWGLAADDAMIAADSLADWVDEDTDARSRGAETDFYAGLGYDDFPRNAAFTSLEELLLVRGMDEVAKRKPDWRDYFTLYGDGEIDINAAEADVIAAFAGIPLSDAESFVETRNGPDGILGTVDDEVYTTENAGEAQTILGIPQERLQELGVSFTLEGTALRIESQATIGDLRYSLVVIADRTSGDQLARAWR